MLRYSNALLVDADNKALILRRSGSHPRYAFHADLPGGTIDGGETHEQTLIREIMEETGIVVTLDDLVPVYRKNSRLAGVEQSLFIVFLSDAQPTVSISWEHDQFDWVELDALKDLEGSIRQKINKIIRSRHFKKLRRSSSQQ